MLYMRNFFLKKGAPLYPAPATRWLLRIYCLCVGILFAIPISAQDFQNGELEGASETLDSVPPGWHMVPYNDPVCQAGFPGGASPDILSKYGPMGQFGVWGDAHSGLTFSAGGYGDDPWAGGFVQEGIMQTVSGFLPGASYSVNFYQTVVRLSSARDTSGSWAVYMDSTLIGVTTPTGTAKTWKSVVLDWEFRSLSFTATAATHTFKFLPMEDDSLFSPPFFNLNMGIDSLFIVSNPILDAGDQQLEAGLFDQQVEKETRFAYHHNRLSLLSAGSAEEIWKLQLHDMDGKVLRKAVLTDGIDLNGLSRGLYVARLSEGRTGRLEVMKLLVE